MRQETRILIIHDDKEICRDLSVVLAFLGEVILSASLAEWQSVVKEKVQSSEEVGLVVLGGIKSGSRVLMAISEWDPGMPVFMVGGEIPEDCDETIRQRVIAHFELPLNYNKTLDSLYRAQVFKEQHRVKRGRTRQRQVLLFRSLVGTSRGVHQVRELMEQVADKDVSVMIRGESGTGKEVVARNLHYNSSRRNKPFVPVNCGAIPAELLESELFGHEKGAFTGAITARSGRFELAEGGTLFLDEIGDMPLSMQVKILRVLQERTFERVGGNKTLSSDVRIVAATHKNLESMIEEGTFREDLYYRLNVFPIEMPALRERVEDIPLLINELVSRMEKEKRGSIRFNSAAIMSICQHEWPGNVRELANLVERLAIMHPYGVVGLRELPGKYRHIEDEDDNVNEEELGKGLPSGLAVLDASVLLPLNGLDLKEYLGDLEKTLIQQALEETSWVVARAAEKLRIRRTTLVEKVRKYGLNKVENDDSSE